LSQQILDRAKKLDQADKLSFLREKFHIPRHGDGSESLYFCGNSLGLQPKHTAALMEEERLKWQELGVKGHFLGKRPWMPFHKELSDDLASLAGALPSEVVVMNSLTVNLHLLMVSFYRPTPSRYRILLEEKAFPSDHFAAESQVRFHGFDPKEGLILLRPEPGEATLRTEKILEAIETHKDSLALILLPGVQYYTGQVFPVRKITDFAQKFGITIGFDLAHGIGNIPFNLHDDGVDFAVWCHYKYVNSGPGATGGAFVHGKHHHRNDLPRLTGWWGHKQETRFKMETSFEPMGTVEAWQLSNPPIQSLICIRGALDLFKEAGGMRPLREKSVALTGFLEDLILENLGDKIHILTPRDPQARGAQLSLEIAPGKKMPFKVFEELEARGITCDWRHPNVIRVAPAPLYNSFFDVAKFVMILEEVIDEAK
jgi:kynureninase